jgi:hypothetical protein
VFASFIHTKEGTSTPTHPSTIIHPSLIIVRDTKKEDGENGLENVPLGEILTVMM